MPVEIREIVIRGTVHEDGLTEANPSLNGPSSDPHSPEMTALIRRMIDAALRKRTDR